MFEHLVGACQGNSRQTWLGVWKGRSTLVARETSFGADAVELDIHEFTAQHGLSSAPLLIDRLLCVLFGYLGFRPTKVEMHGTSAFEIARWDVFGKATGWMALPLSDAVPVLVLCRWFWLRGATLSPTSAEPCIPEDHQGHVAFEMANQDAEIGPMDLLWQHSGRTN